MGWQHSDCSVAMHVDLLRGISLCRCVAGSAISTECTPAVLFINRAYVVLHRCCTSMRGVADNTCLKAAERSSACIGNAGQWPGRHVAQWGYATGLILRVWRDRFRAPNKAKRGWVAIWRQDAAARHHHGTLGTCDWDATASQNAGLLSPFSASNGVASSSRDRGAGNAHISVWDSMDCSYCGVSALRAHARCARRLHAPDGVALVAAMMDSCITRTTMLTAQGP
jgi:hypothetical protein